MKKWFVLAIMFIVITWSGMVMADPEPFSQVSVQTGSAVITTGSGYYYGMTIVTDGVNAATVNVYDNTAGSGTKLISTLVFPATCSAIACAININPGVRFSNGVYVSVVSAGTFTYTAFYRNG